MAQALITLPIVLVWIALLVFFRVYRIWLPFYVLGSVGLTGAIVYYSHSLLPVETWLKTFTAINTNQLAHLIGVPTQVFDGVPGAVLVLVIAQEIGWTLVRIDVECSSLLENAVLVGLFMFYPAWPIGKRATLALIGLILTYVANLLRLLVIIGILHWGGKDTLFVTHTFVGRAIFFLIVIFAYWFLLTQPTIAAVTRNLRRALSE